jgi:hypothetical protein
VCVCVCFYYARVYLFACVFVYVCVCVSVARVLQGCYKSVHSTTYFGSEVVNVNRRKKSMVSE